IARRVHAELERRDPERAAEQLDRLGRPFLFWSYGAHVHFDGRFRDGAVAYRGFDARPSPSLAGLFQALARGDRWIPGPGRATVLRGDEPIAAVGDLEPLAFPFFFNWDDQWFPYRRRPVIALLDLKTT